MLPKNENKKKMEIAEDQGRKFLQSRATTLFLFNKLFYITKFFFIYRVSGVAVRDLL